MKLDVKPISRFKESMKELFTKNVNALNITG
jgi:hypothetical protein